jgi:hypothetical protein
MGSISDHDLNILHPFVVKIRNNLTTSAFDEMLHFFPRQAWRILLRHNSMFGLCPTSSPWNLHTALTSVYAILVHMPTLTDA